MAAIQCVNSGRVFWEVSDELVQILCEGLPSQFVRVQKKSTAPIAPPETEWAVATNHGGGGVHIRARMGSRVEGFAGDPENAVGAFKRIGLQCPPHIIEDYRIIRGQQIRPKE